MKVLLKYGRWLPVLLCWLFFPVNTEAASKSAEQLYKLIGPRDSVLVVDPKGRVIFSKHADAMRTPASVLKIFTSLTAMHYLGPDYRFSTEFYLDSKNNLKIKGYGDPLLISEELKKIAVSLAANFITQGVKVNDLVLDDSYFVAPIVIPGIGESSRPHDAPNGALCVNFNTVFFKNSKNGPVSAEEHTPLLPSAIKRIRQSGLKSGRIVFSRNIEENLNYAGELFQYFLKHEGVSTSGRIQKGRIQKASDRLIFRYSSSYTLKQVVSKLLDHSNNFMANQILIAAGAKAYNAPGTLEKGIAAASAYAKNILGINTLSFVEGSGISRENKVSAVLMDKFLNAFSSHYLLMRHEGSVFFKTGTLYGVNTMAGYIEGKNGGMYKFVVLINSPGKSAKQILDMILEIGI